MTRGFIRGFSLGIILTCLILFMVDITLNKEANSKDNARATINEETLSTILKEKGQTAIHISEYNRLKELDQDQQNSNKNQTIKKESSEQTKQTEVAQMEKEDAIISYTLHVKPGMTSTDISKELAQAKLLGKAVDLENYLKEKGWEGKIQVGSFKLDSQMSIDEIARIITKQG